MQKRGCYICIQSGALSALPLLAPFSMLCTLKAQVEAGVNQLNIYTFLAFIMLHTYLTSLNGTLLTPFNSYSKQVLLAQLRCKNLLCNTPHPPCPLHLLNTRDFVNNRQSMSQCASQD